MRLFQPIFAASALVLISASCLSAATLTHEFTFEDGTANDGVGSLLGTLFGDATISGGILQLDGDGDYVELNGYALPSDGRDYSIVVTAQQLARAPGEFMELISQGVSGGPGMYIGHDPAGELRVGDANLSETNTANVAYPTDGAFVDIVLTSAAATGTFLYIDGVEVFSSGIYAAVTDGGGLTRFGRQFDPFQEFFTGNIDYVAVYYGIKTPEVKPPNVIPLPASALLLPLGLLALASLGRRRA